MKLNLILLLVTFESSVLCAQVFEKQELLTFGGRVDNPITLEVIRTKDVLSFYADNKSIFPYRLELRFNVFRNLIPYKTSEEFTVQRGRNLLFKLTIADPNQAPDFSYSIRYRMGDPNQKADENFSYLFPGAKGRMLKTHAAASNISYIYRGTFASQKGDTVFAIRKGIVTAMPNMEKTTDRIMKNTLEVRHADGTVAVYSNIDFNLPLVQYGDKIFPGQPIGIVGELDFLRVNVYKFLEETRLVAIQIKYAVSESKSVTFDEFTDTLVEYPETIIEKELTDREVKKFRKGNLYPIPKGE